MTRDTDKARGVEPVPPVGGPFRPFSPCCLRFASAKLRPPRRKCLENFSPTGAKLFSRSEFLSRREKSRGEYCCINKRFYKVWAEIRPIKPVWVRLPSSYATVLLNPILAISGSRDACGTFRKKTNGRICPALFADYPAFILLSTAKCTLRLRSKHLICRQCRLYCY